MKDFLIKFCETDNFKNFMRGRLLGFYEWAYVSDKNGYPIDFFFAQASSLNVLRVKCLIDATRKNGGDFKVIDWETIPFSKYEALCERGEERMTTFEVMA